MECWVHALLPEGGSHSSHCSIRRDGTVVSPSEDGLHRQGTRRDCKGDVVTWNILRIFLDKSPEGYIHSIQGIKPLVQDVLQVQLVFSSEYSHVGQSVTENFYIMNFRMHVYIDSDGISHCRGLHQEFRESNEEATHSIDP